MKKTAIFLIVFMLCSLLSAFDTFSMETEDMYPDDNIKAGKAFNIYIPIAGDIDLTSIHFDVHYNRERLDFKSVSIDNKSAEDKILYEEHNGVIEIIYLNTDFGINDKKVVVRFQPKSSQYLNFTFETDICELCDSQLEYIKYEKRFKLDVALNSDGNVIQTNTASTDKSVSKSQKTNDSLTLQSDNPSSPATNGENQSETTYENNETDDFEEQESSQNDIYRITLEDEKVSGKAFESWILYIVIAVLAVSIFFLWFGKRNRP